MPHLKPLFDRFDLASPVEIRNVVMLTRMAVDDRGDDLAHGGDPPGRHDGNQTTARTSPGRLCGDSAGATELNAVSEAH